MFLLGSFREKLQAPVALDALDSVGERHKFSSPVP